MSKLARGFRHWWRDTKGTAMVEFAIICTILLVILFGIIDMGHALYMKAVVTNASREGARYGIRYQVDSSSNRIAPEDFASHPPLQNISDYVKNTYLSQTFIPQDPPPEVSFPTMQPIDGYTTGTSGAPLAVRVTATKTWFVLNNFIPGLGDSMNLSATTVMQCE
jgi:Flp pilus assembly pilin Flp